MYKNKTALLLAGLLAGPVWSQEEAALDPRAELAEYARYAEQHNPKLKQALARYQGRPSEGGLRRVLGSIRA